MSDETYTPDHEAVRGAYWYKRHVSGYEDQADTEFDRFINKIKADTVSGLLGIHTKSKMQHRIPRWQRLDENDTTPYHWCNECEDTWPCMTVQLIQEAINE